MSTVNSYTMQDWISQFREEANTVDAFTLCNAISDGKTAKIFADSTILSKYRVELDQFKVSKRLTPDEAHYYAFNPRLLAYELYKIPELWYLILYANEMTSASQFCKRTIKFYKFGVITVLNSIRQIERERLDANTQAMTNIVLSQTPTNYSGALKVTVGS